jgi:hypothetical protein
MDYRRIARCHGYRWIPATWSRTVDCRETDRSKSPTPRPRYRTQQRYRGSVKVAISYLFMHSDAAILPRNICGLDPLTHSDNRRLHRGVSFRSRNRHLCTNCRWSASRTSGWKDRTSRLGTCQRVCKCGWLNCDKEQHISGRRHLDVFLLVIEQHIGAGSLARNLHSTKPLPSALKTASARCITCAYCRLVGGYPLHLRLPRHFMNCPLVC